MLETTSSPQAVDLEPANNHLRPAYVPPKLQPIDGVSSYIYEGVVRHRRHQHAPNHFNFSVFYFLLDLDEIETVFNKHWLWSVRKTRYGSFRRSDYLKKSPADQPLKKSAIELLKQTGVNTPIGKIRLLTQLRYCGFQMNPVSFYYCYDLEDRNIAAIIVEVNNTPWGEQHTYVINGFDPTRKLILADNIKKTFHVSPFMQMDMDYRMLFSRPGEKIGIKMENHQNSEKVFDVSLALKRRHQQAGNLCPPSWGRRRL